jgi:hypothetical protein
MLAPSRHLIIGVRAALLLDRLHDDEQTATEYDEPTDTTTSVGDPVRDVTLNRHVRNCV